MRILIIALAFLFASCEYIVPKENGEQEEERKAVARVNESFLYEDDLSNIFPEKTIPEDSLDIRNRFVNSWIRKQLLLDKAEGLSQLDGSEIERKVQDYRYALIAFEFKKQYISENLLLDVTGEEIKKYYEDNLDNFLLNQNIVKCRYIQVPLEAPKTNKIYRILGSDKDKDVEELNSYCFQFASNFNLEDTIWLNFDDIVLNTPLKSIPNKIQFLKTNKMVQTQDSVFKYMLYIKEYKIQEQLSPLEFVSDQIENIIINKRKVALSKELENKIYQEGVEQNSFEIF